MCLCSLAVKISKGKLPMSIACMMKCLLPLSVIVGDLVKLKNNFSLHMYISIHYCIHIHDSFKNILILPQIKFKTLNTE